MSKKSPPTLIRGGRLIDPANNIDRVADLYLAGGKVVGVGEAPEGFKAEKEIDATGQVVCPGLIDLSARLREPGQESKATIASETAAAVRAGITTLCCQPDTDPPIDTPAVANLIQRLAKAARRSRVLPIGALTRGLEGEKLTNMAALRDAGCIALGSGQRQIRNALVAYRAMEYASTFDLLVMTHPEDADLHANGCAHQGPVATRLGLPGILQAAETVAVARDLALAKETDCRIHLQLLSSGDAARLVRKAQREQIRVSAAVAAHQLHLTEMDLDGFDSNCHLIPPLRSLTDRDQLRDAVAEGVIGAICSDHQPHEPDAKLAPFPATSPGISALETLLPLTLKLVEEKLLDLSTAIARLTSGPAAILGLPLGRLDLGRAADICIFDPNRTWRLTAESLHSHGHNTPFIGWEMTGWVTHTLLEGRLVYQEPAGR